MAVQVNYSDYNTNTIRDVKIRIGNDKYEIIKPILIKSEEETQNKKGIKIEVKDETLSLSIDHEMDLSELREYIQVLQRLAYQLKQTEKEADC